MLTEYCMSSVIYTPDTARDKLTELGSAQDLRTCGEVSNKSLSLQNKGEGADVQMVVKKKKSNFIDVYMG